MLEIIEDTLLDGMKLLPFLFITYLIMEFIEHKTGDKAKNIIKKSSIDAIVTNPPYRKNNSATKNENE